MKKKTDISLNELVKGSCMNRITLAGSSFLSFTSAYFITLPATIPIIENGSLNPNNISTQDATCFLTALVLCATSAYFIGLTRAGRDTLIAYKNTKQHIQRTGRLDPRLIKALVNTNPQSQYDGYCDLQGIYLAAKEHNQLEAYSVGKTRYTKNVVPNF